MWTVFNFFHFVTASCGAILATNFKYGLPAFLVAVAPFYIVNILYYYTTVVLFSIVVS
jgi:hypothetical protein